MAGSYQFFSVRKSSSVNAVGKIARMAESTYTVTAVATRFASAESAVMSDEDPSYAKFSQLFAEHKTINQSKAYEARSRRGSYQKEEPAHIPHEVLGKALYGKKTVVLSVSSSDHTALITYITLTN